MVGQVVSCLHTPMQCVQQYDPVSLMRSGVGGCRLDQLATPQNAGCRGDAPLAIKSGSWVTPTARQRSGVTSDG